MSEKKKEKPIEVWYGEGSIEIYVDERVYGQMKELIGLKEIEDVPNDLSKHLVGKPKVTIWTNEYIEEERSMNNLSKRSCM